MLPTNQWVTPLLLLACTVNLPTPDALLVPSLIRSSTTPSTVTTFTAVHAHSYRQAALQLMQGASSSPSASVSGTYAACSAACTDESMSSSFPYVPSSFLTPVYPHVAPPLLTSHPHDTYVFKHFPPLTDPYTPPAVAQSVHRASLPDPDAADLTGTGDSVRVVTQQMKKNDGPAITNYVEISLSTKEGMRAIWGSIWDQEGLPA